MEPNNDDNNLLSHLTQLEIATLIQRYYGREGIQNLIDEYGIRCRPTELFRAFPPDSISEKCPACGSMLAQKRYPRTTPKPHREVIIHCPLCQHSESAGCKCDYCENLKLDAVKKIQQEIDDFCHQWWNYDVCTRNVGEMALSDAVYLLSLEKSCHWLTNDSRELSSLSDATIPLSPMNQLDSRITEHLTFSRLISPSPNSTPNSLIFDNCKPINFIPELVYWCCYLYDAGERLKQMRGQLTSGRLPFHWSDQKDEFTRLVYQCAIAECRQYYSHFLESEKLPNAGDRAANELVEDLLTHYSVAQCARIFWVGVKQATEYKHKSGITAQHASNTSIQNCRRYADNALENNSPITPFRRNRNLPRSAFSLILHGVVLGHGDDGFTLKMDDIIRRFELRLSA